MSKGFEGRLRGGPGSVREDKVERRVALFDAVFDFRPLTPPRLFSLDSFSTFTHFQSAK